MMVAAEAQPVAEAAVDPAVLDAGACIDRIISLGWVPSLIAGVDGLLMRSLGRRSDLTAEVERQKLEEWWIETTERRRALVEAMERRGLVSRA